MKKLLGILVIGLCGITRCRLDTEEIKQEKEKCEQRKRKQTLENDTGSWWLFTGLEVHTTSHYFTLVHTSYADNLKFIKNKSHKDSSKIQKN